MCYVLQTQNTQVTYAGITDQRKLEVNQYSKRVERQLFFLCQYILPKLET